MYREVTLLSAVVSLLVTAAVLAVFVAIWLDFKRYGGQRSTRRQKHSAVATGTMVLFFCGYYLVLRFAAGTAYPSMRWVRLCMMGAGVLMVLCGAACNIWGRVVLGRNWANHIKIYSDHTLVTTGPFRYVRHPLYSSLFLMFYGGSVLYANWLGAVLTTLLFVPMMNYRAAQEEAILRQTFGEYAAYSKRAGRFLPKSLRGYRGNGR